MTEPREGKKYQLPWWPGLSPGGQFKAPYTIPEPLPPPSTTAMGAGGLPRQITLPDGRIVDVMWELYDVAKDAAGNEVDLYVPVPEDRTVFNKAFADTLSSYIATVGPTGESRFLTEVETGNLNIEADELYQSVGFASLQRELANQGLGGADVEDLLKNYVRNIMPGMPLDAESVLETAGKMQKYPQYKKRLRLEGRLAPLSKQAAMQEEAADKQFVEAVTGGLSQGGVWTREIDQIQNFIERYKPFYEEHKPLLDLGIYDPLRPATTREQLTTGLLTSYEGAQKRVAEIESGQGEPGWEQTGPTEEDIVAERLAAQRKSQEEAQRRAWEGLSQRAQQRFVTRI